MVSELIRIRIKIKVGSVSNRSGSVTLHYIVLQGALHYVAGFSIVSPGSLLHYCT